MQYLGHAVSQVYAPSQVCAVPQMLTFLAPATKTYCCKVKASKVSLEHIITLSEKANLAGWPLSPDKSLSLKKQEPGTLETTQAASDPLSLLSPLSELAIRSWEATGHTGHTWHSWHIPSPQEHCHISLLNVTSRHNSNRGILTPPLFGLRPCDWQWLFLSQAGGQGHKPHSLAYPATLPRP